MSKSSSSKSKSSNSSAARAGRRKHARRTRIVWTAFGAAMTVAAGGLLATGGGLDGGLGAAPLASNVSFSGSFPQRTLQLDTDRFKTIVIHHSGSPGGSPESLDRLHRSLGYASLGYHFVIGNGIDFGDGAIYTGPRWLHQDPGAHVAPREAAVEPTAEWFNEHSIGICLVGNGERRGFSESQVTRLADLVSELQRNFNIPDTQVHLHSDLSDVASPGRFFPVAAFESLLRD
ncbi:MAG: peptidoglycan recognition family protein [Phycisphaerae bacterium]|nr:peptidoglycan recognition family protein [Phycisphaerae bacterium]